MYNGRTVTWTLGFNFLTKMLFQSLVLANSSKRQYTVGDVCNMLTADTQRIADFMYYHHYVWITPITAVVMMYFLWQYVGIASLSGFFTLVFIVLINFAIVGRAKKYEVRGVAELRSKVLRDSWFQVSAVKQKDHRVRNINEIFSGIKILKLYAWEPQFEQRIIDAREDEVGDSSVTFLKYLSWRLPCQISFPQYFRTKGFPRFDLRMILIALALQSLKHESGQKRYF